MNYRKISLALLSLILFINCINPPVQTGRWQTLFNGKDLKGWDTYLGPKYDSVQKKWGKIPIGLNIDPLKVFSVVQLDGEKVIRISGEQFGGISTISEFSDYHLQLQFKWGSRQWAPRKTGQKDSGLMYHAVGPQGADGGFWMRSQEFQIEEGDCGDFWACAGAIFDVKARKEGDSYVYDRKGELLTFSTESPIGRHCIKSADAEKPSGEWNTLDLYCFGGTSVHMMNGVVNMILNNSRQFENGKEIPLTRGKIQIESEGAEIFFRNIRLTSIDKLPGEIIQ